MTNLNPKEHDNVINPYTLSKEKQQAIVSSIDDDRLTNPPGDYFKLQLNDEVIDIPKLETISTENAAGRIESISVVDYVKKQLSKIDKS